MKIDRDIICPICNRKLNDNDNIITIDVLPNKSYDQNVSHKECMDKILKEHKKMSFT